MEAFNIKSYLWSKKDGSFGKVFPVSEAATPDVTGSKKREVARWTNVGGPIQVGGRQIYSSSEVAISIINTKGVVKIITQIADSPPNPDDESSGELDGEEVEVVLNSTGHHSSTSPSQPAAKRFQSQLVPSTPRNFQPVLSTIPSTIPPHFPSPPLVLTLRPSPIPQPKNSPMVISQQLQPVDSSRRTI
ncbi:hypothetical protein O181_077838 [Austropuccinia psidii MF-1]|uniref:Uncharacterized protein n=1 Tax=Austropuccinia psidii MF-1 TaxID=1389203 RepID=A0A9Q3FHR6_9BASI|nr:hypothetical protein [Austropuccinia psidii MF-1]